MTRKYGMLLFSKALFPKLCVCQVGTKSVAQCVEYYYTYKKHVKIGRNGTLLYGEAGLPESRTNEAELDHKVSLWVGVSPAHTHTAVDQSARSQTLFSSCYANTHLKTHF